MASMLSENLKILKSRMKCSICLEILSNPLLTPCMHLYCASCIDQLLKTKNAKCPLCNKSLKKRDLKKHPLLNKYCEQAAVVFEKFAEENDAPHEDDYSPIGFTQMHYSQEISQLESIVPLETEKPLEEMNKPEDLNKIPSIDRVDPIKSYFFDRLLHRSKKGTEKQQQNEVVTSPKTTKNTKKPPVNPTQNKKPMKSQPVSENLPLDKLLKPSMSVTDLPSLTNPNKLERCPSTATLGRKEIQDENNKISLKKRLSGSISNLTKGFLPGHSGGLSIINPEESDKQSSFLLPAITRRMSFSRKNNHPTSLTPLSTPTSIKSRIIASIKNSEPKLMAIRKLPEPSITSTVNAPEQEAIIKMKISRSLFKNNINSTSLQRNATQKTARRVLLKYKITRKKRLHFPNKPLPLFQRVTINKSTPKKCRPKRNIQPPNIPEEFNLSRGLLSPAPSLLSIKVQCNHCGESIGVDANTLLSISTDMNNASMNTSLKQNVTDCAVETDPIESTKVDAAVQYSPEPVPIVVDDEDMFAENFEPQEVTNDPPVSSQFQVPVGPPLQEKIHRSNWSMSVKRINVSKKYEKKNLTFSSNINEVPIVLTEEEKRAKEESDRRFSEIMNIFKVPSEDTTSTADREKEYEEIIASFDDVDKESHSSVSTSHIITQPSNGVNSDVDDFIPDSQPQNDKENEIPSSSMEATNSSKTVLYKNGSTPLTESIASTSWFNNFTPQQFNLTTSGLSQKDKDIVSQFCNKFSQFKNQSKFTPGETTHLIVKPDPVDIVENITCLRTLKYFYAVMNGAWIVSIAWCAACLNEGQLISELPFEIVGDSAIGAVTSAPRKGRESKNLPKKLFSNLAFCPVYPLGSNLSINDLKALVTAGNGQFIPNINELAKFKSSSPNHRVYILTNSNAEDFSLPSCRDLYRRYSAQIVNIEWLLDCISYYSVIPMAKGHAVWPIRQH